MTDPNLYGVAQAEQCELAQRFERALEPMEIETGYDYRWVQGALTDVCDRLFSESCLANQVVEFDLGEVEHQSTTLIMRDGYGRRAEFTTDKAVVGIVQGFYAHVQLIGEPEPESSTMADVEQPVSILDGVETASLATIHDVDYSQVDMDLGYRVQPFRLPPGLSLDAETAFIEIPSADIGLMTLPEVDHPLIPDQAIFNVQYASLANMVEFGEIPVDDMQSLLHEILKEVTFGTSTFGRRVSLGVAGTESIPVVIRTDDSAELVDLPCVSRVSGRVIGFGLMPGDYTAEKYPELEVSIATDEELTNIVEVPLSQIVDGELESLTVAETDQKLFATTLQFFNNFMEAQIESSPMDHAAADAAAQQAVNALNDGADMLMHQPAQNRRGLLVQLDRDTPFEMTNIPEDETTIDIADCQEEMLQEIPLGGHFSLACTIVAYSWRRYSLDEGVLLTADDFGLMAILKPYAYTIFDFFDGNALMVPVASISNSRLAHVNYN